MNTQISELKFQITQLQQSIKDLDEECERYSAMEQAVKIVLNGGYGALGAAAFRWYDETIAEGITATGRVGIQYITKKINEFVNEKAGTDGIDYVVSSDTDSVYFEVDAIVKHRWPEVIDKQQITDLVNEFAENEAGPYIDQCYKDLSDYLNCDVNLLDMKREAIADTFIIRAKKNYIMRVFDNEGIRYADPYYKMMGIEVVRTSHPQMIRDALEDTLKMVIEGSVEQVRSYVKEFKTKFMNSPLNQIAAPRGISDITKYMNSEDYSIKEFEYVTNEFGNKVKSKITIPIHVRAAINYNYLVNKYKLSNKFEFIKNGSKIKFLPLKEPNPIKSHVIGFIDNIPTEFGLDEFIDKEAHFNKMFISPLETFLIYNGWTIQENTLLDMFGSSDIDMATAAINTKKKTIKKVDKKTTSLF